MNFPARLHSSKRRAFIFAAVVFCALAPKSGMSLDGDVKFSPKLGISYTRNNNFYYQSVNKLTSNGLILSPSLEVAAKTSRLNASASVSTHYAQFDTRNDDDNYFDPNFTSSLEYKAGTSHLISFDGQAQLGHDAFGQNRTQGAAVTGGELDQWFLGGGGLRYRLGAPEALFNFEISGFGTKKIYTTNTLATGFLDYGAYGGTLTSFINISPKTAILAEGGYSEVRFDRLFATGDNREANEYFWRVGAHWKAAAKTTGDVRAGWVERKSLASGIRTFQVFDWVARLVWQPGQRTLLTAATGRQSQESYLAGAAVILNRSNTLSWTQNWTRRWSSNLNATYIQSEFIGTLPERVDDTSSVGLSLSYQAEKYLGIGLGTNYVHRYSNAPQSNFNGLNFSSNINLEF